MKRTSWTIAAIVLFIGCQKSEDIKLSVSPGQIWVYETGSPWEKSTYEYYVIDVKEGWVKYVQVKYKNKRNRKDYEHEWTEWMFKLGARLKDIPTATKNKASDGRYKEKET